MSPKSLTGGTGATARPVPQGGRSPRGGGVSATKPAGWGGARKGRGAPGEGSEARTPSRSGGSTARGEKRHRVFRRRNHGPRGVTYPACARTARKPPRGDSDQQGPPECFAVTEDFPLKHTPPPPDASWACGTRIGRGRQGPRGSRRLASPSLSRNRVESGPEHEEPRRTWHLLTWSKTRARTRGLWQFTHR